MVYIFRSCPARRFGLPSTARLLFFFSQQSCQLLHLQGVFRGERGGCLGFGRRLLGLVLPSAERPDVGPLAGACAWAGAMGFSKVELGVSEVDGWIEGFVCVFAWLR